MLKKYKIDLLLISSLFFFIPLFFYKLGQTSLTSWDEGWYAQVAKNVANTGQFFYMTWNGKIFFDHPPTGFWLVALSFKLFGISNLSDRLPSAMAGLGTLVAVYFLGKHFFNRTIGFASAVSLVSCFWFINRSRAGDLDIFLTLFFVLTMYLALKIRDNSKYLPFFSVSLTLLLMTKTLVPFVIFPVLVVIFWGSKVWRTKQFLISLFLPIIIFAVWFFYQDYLSSGRFLKYYLGIGYPKSDAPSTPLSNAKATLQFIHDGMGKWYWPSMGAIILGVLTRQKRFLILSSFFLIFFLPFLFSNEGRIWHLIPLYPILLLSFFGFFYFVLEKLNGFIKMKKTYLCIPILLVCFYVSFSQIKQMWYQFIDIPAFISDEQILSTEAGKYPGKFIIDGDFVPTAVFYSNKDVSQTWGGGIPETFANNKAFVLITKQYRLDAAQIPPSDYKIIKQDRDRILILGNP